MLSFRVQTPPVVKNLLIINVLLFFAQLSFDSWMTKHGALFPIGSEHFRFHQFVTHLFLHGGFIHILFNMLVLWSFGSVLEQVWTSKRFLLFYFICGLGAGFLHELFTFIQMQSALSHSPYASYGIFSAERLEALRMLPQAYIPAVGASGAISGAIAGFALLFPNSIILVWFIPAKAKYVAIGLFIFELFSGTWGGDSHIANWAHIGGGITGLIIAYFWKKRGYHLR